jgi:ATP-binding cassette subfamily B multidrug efflux pump
MSEHHSERQRARSGANASDERLREEPGIMSEHRSERQRARSEANASDERLREEPGILSEHHSERQRPGPAAPRPQLARGPFAGIGMTEKSLDFLPSARRLLGRLSPERFIVSVVLALNVASVTLSVLGPRLLGHATDLIFAGVLGRRLPAGLTRQQAVQQARDSGHGTLADLYARSGMVPGRGIDFTALRRVVILVLALYLVAALLGWLQGYLLAGAVQRTVYRLRSDVEDKLNRLPLRYFDGQPRGEVLSRVTNDIDNVSQTLQHTLSQMLVSVLTVIAVLSMMVAISPLLALIALVSVPLSVLMTRLVAARSQKLFVAQWRTTGQLNGHIEEAFTGHALVKVFGRQREVEQHFAEYNDELYRTSFGAQFVSGIIMPAVQFIGNLNYVAVAVVGGLRVASGAMSLGDVQAFIQYSRQFTQPLTQVASMANVLQSGVASAERVFELLDTDEQQPDQAVPPVIGDPRGRVEFQHVSFRYEPQTPLIDDLSFVAAPGQTVAIVGPTGAGKTTLVNLIMRFYELDSGRITLDGADIAELTRAGLRSRIGMVLQDTWLFGGTIRDNIGYGNPEAGEEAILAAARASFVDRFVHSLPDGYDTVIDEEGNNVSAGEKQLLTIARAFLAEPSLLILDEATSSVDTRTELLVQQAMAALRSDRTSFVIAHRLSTIRDADLILVMESGRIVEQGNHAELLARGGAYYELYNQQFAGLPV